MYVLFWADDESYHTRVHEHSKSFVASSSLIIDFIYLLTSIDKRHKTTRRRRKRKKDFFQVEVAERRQRPQSLFSFLYMNLRGKLRSSWGSIQNIPETLMWVWMPYFFLEWKCHSHVYGNVYSKKKSHLMSEEQSNFLITRTNREIDKSRRLTQLRKEEGDDLSDRHSALCVIFYEWNQTPARRQTQLFWVWWKETFHCDQFASFIPLALSLLLSSNQCLPFFFAT